MAANPDPKAAPDAAKTATSDVAEAPAGDAQKNKPKPPREFGGPTGPEPTRYGDWERNGRVSDF